MGLIGSTPCASSVRATTLGRVNLHDWIDELCDALDLEAEFDEALVLDVAREAAHRVERPAAPVSTFLLGYAAALAGGSLQRTEELAGRVLVTLATGRIAYETPDA